MAARPWSLLASTASRPRARAAVRPRPSSRLRPRPSSPSSSMPERARSPSSVSPAATSRGSSPRQRPDPPPRALPRAPVAGAAQPGPCPSPFSLWFPLSLLISPLFLFSQGTKSHGALVPSPRKRTISAAADLVATAKQPRATMDVCRGHQPSPPFWTPPATSASRSSPDRLLQRRPLSPASPATSATTGAASSCCRRRCESSASPALRRAEFRLRCEV